MKAYLKWSKNNFGDELNDIIFPELGYTHCIEYNKKNLLNLDANCILGLGTLLTKKIKSPVTVAGSGSDGLSKPQVDLNYIFVRGKLTARYLNLDESLGIGDPAYYLSDYIQSLSSVKKSRKIGIIPHWSSLDQVSGEMIISPFLPINNFIYEVSRCEYVLAEAMHGAICADILRIPFAPIKIRNDINEFKWKDWASTMGLEIEFGDINNYKTILSTDLLFKRTTENVKDKLNSLK